MLGKSPDRRSPVDMDLVKKISSTPPYRSDLTHQPTLSQEKPMTLSEGAFSDSSELGAARQPQPRAPSPGLMLGYMIIPVHPGTTTDFMEKHFERRWQYSTTRHYQHDQRDCNHIARCLEKILKLRFFRFELTKQLIAVKLEPHEDSITYADRLQQLVKLSRADREGTERFTVSVVAESLPDGRYERLKAHFGSEDSIRTVHDIIHLVRKPPGTLSGRTTDRAEWVWRHFRQAESEEQLQDPRKVAYRLNKSLNHRKNCSSRAAVSCSFNTGAAGVSYTSSTRPAATVSYSSSNRSNNRKRLRNTCMNSNNNNQASGLKKQEGLVHRGLVCKERTEAPSERMLDPQPSSAARAAEPGHHRQQQQHLQRDYDYYY
ncbi:hypothetical protein BGZ67_003256 [Mortierella alpina]|nr:hypothetical protein BGZ67_003256 [Mortierella alpina]